MPSNSEQSTALDMLIFGAHPDDAEIGMGGTILRHTKAGLRVGICDLTYAELSSNGDVETRKQEAGQAAHILGLAMRSNLGLPDRGLHRNDEQIKRVTLEIRKHRPRIVMAPYWEDRHPDHVVCSHIVQEAVFNAKLRKYKPDVPAFTVDTLLFYFINDVGKADLIVDISEVAKGKMKALQAYRSQFTRPGAQGADDFVPTAINQGYLERVQARDHLLGQQANVTYAEGFVSKQPYLVDLFGRRPHGK